MAARQQSQRYPTNAGPAAAIPSVRRNLFNSQLSRRPTRSNSVTSTAPTLVENPIEPDSNDDSSSDILIRHPNGDYAAKIPTISFLMADPNGANAGDEPSDELEDDAHLMELLRTRTRQSNEQELLDAVRISLKRKVEALAEDDWMFSDGNRS